MKKNLIGTVANIRVIKSLPDMLVRFTLETQTGKVNCLVANKEIVNQLLFFEEEETEVAVFGHYNQREQLVIEKLMIRRPTSFLLKYASGSR